MEDDFFALGASIISIVSTFLVTYVIAVVKLRKNVELKFDVELQKNRIEPYKKIWKTLHSLKKIQNKGTDITKTDCEKLLKKIRIWYHDENGGMWLSRKAMEDGYQTLKDRLKEISKSESENFPKIWNEDKKKWEEDKELKKVLDQISYFRTLLTSDLGTRRKPIFKNKEDDRD